VFSRYDDLIESNRFQTDRLNSLSYELGVHRAQAVRHEFRRDRPKRGRRSVSVVDTRRRDSNARFDSPRRVATAQDCPTTSRDVRLRGMSRDVRVRQSRDLRFTALDCRMTFALTDLRHCMGTPLSVPCPARQAGRTSNALVLLPEYLHANWTLPPGDTAYPTRWGWISSQRSTQTLPSPHGGGRAGDGGANVAERGGCAVRTIVRFHSAMLTLTPGPSPVEGEGRGSCDNVGRQRERRRGVWQPRYWEHTLESEEDFERHFDYVHDNPVKHDHVICPGDWMWSTFHQWVQAGVYPPNWAGVGRRPFAMDFDAIAHSVGDDL
jgi:putative transposase